MRAILAFALIAMPAFAGQHDPEWNPPAQFDHAYHGELRIHRVPVDRIGVTCNALFKFYGYKGSFPKHGCSSGDQDGLCEVAIPRGPVQLATPDAVVRHEIGHCNGWPADHPQ